MRERFVPFLFAAVLSAVTAVAQVCPHTAAEAVREHFNFQGMRDCGNTSIRFAGVEVAAPQQGCPLIVSYVPAHDIEVPATGETRTEITQDLPTYLLSYRCERRMLLFLVIDSDCRLDNWIVSGTVHRRRTVPCSGT